MMHFHWQATPLSPGLSLSTNLCPLLASSSIQLSPFFSPPSEGFCELCSLSIFLALVSECLHCVTVSCNFLRNNPFLFSPLPLYLSLVLSVCEKRIFHAPSLSSLHSQLSQFLLHIAFHILFSFTLCHSCFHPFYLVFLSPSFSLL